MRIPVLLFASLVLAGCGGEMVPRPAPHVPVPKTLPPETPANLVAINGQTAGRLIATFGTPRLDLTEGQARKLQFAGPICVLDAYLYPQKRGEPVVTHIDTRQRDGSSIDEASCVAALTRRR